MLEIFKAKGRPLTDPLIVHVGDADKALALLEISGRDRSIFEYLAARFWPGPLTLVAKGAPQLPKCVSAGTGYVGVRCPRHELARQLAEDGGERRVLLGPEGRRHWTGMRMESTRGDDRGGRSQQAGEPLHAAAGLAEVVGWAAGPGQPPATTWCVLRRV